MTHMHFTHKGCIRKGLSILLSLFLLCNFVISFNVITEAESDVTVETVEITDANSDETSTIVNATIIVTEDDEPAVDSEAEAPADTDLTESVPPGVIMNGSYNDITITVEAAEDAFTEEVSVSVTAADEDAFKAAVLEACAGIYPEDTCTVIDVAAINISFLAANGEELEPASEVKVTVSGLTLETESADEDETTHTANYALIFHMDDEGNIEWIGETNEPGQEAFEFVASEFSDYGIATVEVSAEAEEEKNNPGGTGGNQECDPSYYTSSAYVFYDTFNPTYNNDGEINGGSVNTAARNYIESVTLNSISVVQRDSVNVKSLA